MISFHIQKLIPKYYMAYVSVKLALYFESETKGFVNIAANFAVKQNVRICDVFLTAILRCFTFSFC